MSDSQSRKESLDRMNDLKRSVAALQFHTREHSSDCTNPACMSPKFPILEEDGQLTANIAFLEELQNALCNRVGCDKTPKATPPELPPPFCGFPAASVTVD